MLCPANCSIASVGSLLPEVSEKEENERNDEQEEEEEKSKTTNKAAQVRYDVKEDAIFVPVKGLHFGCIPLPHMICVPADSDLLSDRLTVLERTQLARHFAAALLRGEVMQNSTSGFAFWWKSGFFKSWVKPDDLLHSWSG